MFTFLYILAFFTTGVGPFELAIVFVAALLLFGTQGLPEAAKTLGKIMEQLRMASNDFKRELYSAPDKIEKELIHPPADPAVASDVEHKPTIKILDSEKNHEG